VIKIPDTTNVEASLDARTEAKDNVLAKCYEGMKIMENIMRKLSDEQEAELLELKEDVILGRYCGQRTFDRITYLEGMK